MSQNDPAISVIVPVYKTQEYLPQCIESILGQSFSDLELILIDDGSPDNSGEICDAYAEKDPRVRVFHIPNGGVSNARNTALNNARGRWVVFVDSDDWIEGDYLKNFHDAVGASSSISLAISGVRQVFKQGNSYQLVYKPATLPAQDAFFERKLYRNGFIAGKFYDRNLIEQYQLRLDTALSLGEDFIFMCHFLPHAQEVTFVEPIGYVYRMFSAGSLSERYWPFEHEKRLLDEFLNCCSHFVEKSGQIMPQDMRVFLRYYVLRAAAAVYRPEHLQARAQRIETLKMLAQQYGWILEGDSRLGARLLLKGYFCLFDKINRVLFALRYGVLRGAWKAYLKTRARLRHAKGDLVQYM